MSETSVEAPSSQSEKNTLGRNLAIALMFFLSGASALMYEVVWSRQLGTLFGATVYAVATVLTAFMGGLALGSWLIGKRADRMERPLFFYGFLELGIGLSALLFPFLLKLAGPIIGQFYASGGEGTFFFFSLVRFVIACVLLMIPTTFMGATLPVMSRAVTRGLNEVGHAVGGLYALNTIGAVTGVFLTGFFLLERFGVWHTTLIAVTVNVVVASLAMILGWGLRVPVQDESVPETTAEAIPAAHSIPPRVVNIVLWSYLFSGLAALCYQVAWTRSLLFGFETLKATTYSFTGMLSVYLLGLAIGSAVMQSLVDRIRDLLSVYVLLQFLIGLLGIFSVYLIIADLPIMFLFEDIDAKGQLNYWGAIGNVLVRTAVSIGLPTLLMGMAFPVVARIVVGSVGRLGHDVGRVYALNTCGAIAGSFLGGFVMIPLLGITNTIAILAGISFAIAVVVIWVHPTLPKSRRPLLLSTIVIAGGVLIGRLALNSNAHTFHPTTIGEEIVYYNEGSLATVSVIEDAKKWRTIYVDAIGVAGTDPVLQTDQKTLAHVPMVLLGGKADAVLTVGFGSGGASYSYTLYPEVKNIHAIEITTNVPKAARVLTDANHGILYEDDVIEEALAELGPDGQLPGAAHPLKDYTVEPAPGFRSFDPRYRIIIDDARAYLRFTEQSYDVIATDCTDLRYKSNANLYDLEYFQLCHDRITDRGLVVVWMPLAGLSDEAFRIVARTFQRVFPEMSIWYFTNQPTHYCLFIGQKDGLKISYGEVLKALENPLIQTDLEEIGLRDPNKLITSFVSDQRGLDAYIKDGALNTENYPIIEFLSPRFGYDARPIAENMGNVYDAQVPVWDTIVDQDLAADQKDALARYQRANDVIFEGHVHYRAFEFDEACQRYMDAKEIAPEDKSIDRLLDFEELRLRCEHELKRPVEAYDELWLNGQWVAFSLGNAYKMQERHEDAVTLLAPFAARMPSPSPKLPPNMKEVGRALNKLIAECYDAAGNHPRADEYHKRAQAYPQ